MPQTIKVDGQIISSPQKICNQMNQHFATIGKNLQLNLPILPKIIITLNFGYLADSFNECIESGNYPDILKIAQVILLHKGRSVLDLGNYKPIPFCPQLTKCLKLFCINVFRNSGINRIYLLIVNLALERNTQQIMLLHT